MRIGDIIRCMIHPHTEVRLISPEIGYGVVATKFIPKGTITWVGDPLDQSFTPKQLQEFDPVFRELLYTYSYRDHLGNFVLCWDNARYVNHSFHSNCISTPYNFELAVRDIHPGEQLTDDYGYLNVTEPFECLPEPGTTRTKVMPDDLLHFYPEWDKKLEEAFRHFNAVHQPLAPLISHEYADKVKRVAAGEAPMDSILNCYFFDGKTKLAA